MGRLDRALEVLTAALRAAVPFADALVLRRCGNCCYWESFSGRSGPCTEHTDWPWRRPNYDACPEWKRRP